MLRILAAGTAGRGRAAGEVQATWYLSPHTHCAGPCGGLGDDEGPRLQTPSTSDWKGLFGELVISLG